MCYLLDVPALYADTPHLYIQVITILEKTVVCNGK